MFSNHMCRVITHTKLTGKFIEKNIDFWPYDLFMLFVKFHNQSHKQFDLLNSNLHHQECSKAFSERA